MLGRAAKEYEPPPKSDLRKTSFPSSSIVHETKLPEYIKKARQPTRTIAGFMNHSQFSPPACILSPTTRPSHTNKNLNLSNLSSSFHNSASNRLFSVLSKQDSFQELQQAADHAKQNSTSTFLSSQFVEINEDDFDDDENLGLDINYHLPKSRTESSLTFLEANTLPTRQTTALRSYRIEMNSSQNLPSSAVTWSSSPPSHKISTLITTGGNKRVSETATGESSSQPVRPPKRRTLPWPKKEDMIRSAMQEVTTIQQASSFPDVKNYSQSNKNGHYTKDCPSLEIEPSNTSFSKTTRNKTFPWDDTITDMQEKKKKLKDKKRSSKNNDDQPAESIDKRPKANLTVTPISLSNEQNNVLDLVVNQSKSVFFTGSAGTGKSVLMRAIIAELRKKYAREPDRVAVTASTGLAACNIGGVTLHSFGGIGLGKDDVPALIKKIKRNPKAKTRWIKTKVLVIDEISMVDGDLFDKLEGVARAMRNNGRPFGGIQLVITGDFFQLPPVPDYDSTSRNIKFAFDANTWTSSIDHTIGLTQVFRQKDPVFANMLNEMRLGKITGETVAAFQRLSRSISDDGYEATELFPTRNEVDSANSCRMRNLQGEIFKFESRDSCDKKYAHLRDKLLSNMMAPKVLELKKGAQVMLIKNMDDGLVNGTLGKIQSFMSEINFKHLKDSPEGLEALGDESVEGATKNSSHSKKQKPHSLADPGQLYPYVSFKLADGTVRMVLILPEEWRVELPSGELQASRVQVPLILAWALSIHKAQGQTLERVKIDLKKVFEKGQAYVALSRATSQAGLQVLNFEKRRVMAHPRVAQFYDSLYSSNTVVERPSAEKTLRKTSKIPQESLDLESIPHDITFDDVFIDDYIYNNDLDNIFDNVIDN
ncbi:ATP-dependent DNA helicase [Podosphaera aphanis]|nr:ATP-dependent DNA helicase [Podosphaera aphanis]